MKHVKTWPVVSALAACSILSFASAQTTKGSAPMPDKEKPMAHAAKNGPCVCFASDMIGTDVVSTTGENLGDIDDIVIHPNGDIAYAVLSFGGVAGLGDKLFAVPWNVLQHEKPADAKMKDNKDKKIVLPVEKEKLKAAPGFDKAHWPSFADANWSRDVDTFYASYRRADDKRPVNATAATSDVVWKASELKGQNVETPGKDKLGDVKEIALDTNGRVSYAVVSVGGFLGIGDRLVAVPWEAFKVMRDGDKKKLTLAATKERLELAPQYVASKDKRDQMCDPKWIGTVYEFYSVRPYWDTSSM